MNKILIVTRHDALEKPGGDTGLLKDIQRAFSMFDCTMVAGVPKSITGYKFVFACNLDRPIEGHQLLKLCKRDSIPLHFMSLHHSSHFDISNYLKEGLFGWKKIIAFFANYDPVNYEQILWNIRVIVNFISRKHKLKFGSVIKAQRALIQESEYLLVVSKEEVESIETDIGVISSKIIIFPHILPFDPYKKIKDQKNNAIFCPGRIECRKNQLFILMVAEHMPEHNFIFMGPINKSDKRFHKLFIKKSLELKNVKVLPAQSITDFKAFLLHSDVVLTASWFEVTSLVELDVLKRGDKLVCNSSSYNSSFFKNSLEYKANDLHDCISKINSAIKNDYILEGSYPEDNEIINSYLETINYES
jgi:hypothetical protein|tara:strand:+ start:13910 stop:14989 length:1080 start_codon:yes stop_codon:yes gene_type:complete